MTNDIAIVGCGYLGLALARALRGRLGDAGRIFGTTTSPQRIDTLRDAGVVPALVKLEDEERLLAVVAPCQTVVLSVAPGRTGQAPENVYRQGVEHLLAVLPRSSVAQVIYTSSTSVYGQDDGAWVDETSPTEPGTAMGRILLDTEKRLQEGCSELGIRLAILRLAGIYAEDRGPANVLERFAGKSRSDGEVFLNLIHRDDAVEALCRLVERGHDGLLSLSDDSPTPRREYYDRLMRQAGLEPIEWRQGDSARGKRVRNTRIKADLGLQLRHPIH